MPHWHRYAYKAASELRSRCKRWIGAVFTAHGEKKGELPMRHLFAAMIHRDDLKRHCPFTVHNDPLPVRPCPSPVSPSRVALSCSWATIRKCTYWDCHESRRHECCTLHPPGRGMVLDTPRMPINGFRRPRNFGAYIEIVCCPNLGESTCHCPCLTNGTALSSGHSKITNPNRSEKAYKRTLS